VQPTRHMAGLAAVLLQVVHCKAVVRKWLLASHDSSHGHETSPSCNHEAGACLTSNVTRYAPTVGLQAKG
jgi:hypothetical protein